MKDSWINHNTDKVMLFILVIGFAALVDHILDRHSGDMQALAIASGAFTTCLGALVMILTGRVQRADGQTANGLPPATQNNPPVPTPVPNPPSPLAKR